MYERAEDRVEIHSPNKEVNKMKLYLVKGWVDENGLDESSTWIYGIFSEENKAKEIKERLYKSIEKHNEKEKIFIDELILDQPTDQYDFMISS